MSNLRRVWVACAFGLTAAANAQQLPDLLNNDDVLKLADRALELADSTAISEADLSQASLPVRDAIRIARDNLRMRVDSGPYVLSLLTQLQSYLAIAKAMPKPVNRQGLDQMNELQKLTVRLESHFRALVIRMESRIRSGDRDNLARYREANLKTPPATPGRVVFYGDSITDFWRLNEFFPGRDFLNRGISGQVASEMLGRFKADVLDLKPETVLILAGTNDLARGTELVAVTNNLAMMSELARAHKIRVILASVLPVNDANKAENPNFERTRFRPPALIRSLNDWIRTYCIQNNFVYLDYFSVMVDSNGLLRPELSGDGLHPNPAGYRVMAPLAAKAIGDGPGPPTQPKQRKKRLLSE
jgi:lysophospholipase L1-like esterase